VIHVATPNVHVGVSFGFDPWNPRAVAVARPGYVFEPGYWSNGVYYDGYWRPERVQREHWVPGHYTAYRGWVPGHWSR
jgi:hypothetical protein